MAQQSSVAQKIENDVRSTLNANLLKGKSDFSHATWFACVDILFEKIFCFSLYEISSSPIVAEIGF